MFLETRVLKELRGGKLLKLTLYPIGKRGAGRVGPSEAGMRMCSNCGQHGHTKAKCPEPRDLPSPEVVTITVDGENIARTAKEAQLMQADGDSFALEPKAKQPGFDLVLGVPSGGSGDGAARCLWVNMTVNATHELKLETKAPSMLEAVTTLRPDGDVEVVWLTTKYLLEDFMESVNKVIYKSEAGGEVAGRVRQYVAMHEAIDPPEEKAADSEQQGLVESNP